MKKKIVVTMAVIVIVAVSFAFINNLMNIKNLEVSENKIEYYPSQRHMIVLHSASPIDKNQIQIKNKDIYVKNEGCEQTDLDYSCLLSFSGFKAAKEKVEIKYGNKKYYVNVTVKSFDDHKKNMSPDEEFEIAQAKLLTKYRVISSDDIKDEKVRLKVENELEKLGEKYRSME